MIIGWSAWRTTIALLLGVASSTYPCTRTAAVSVVDMLAQADAIVRTKAVAVADDATSARPFEHSGAFVSMSWTSLRVIGTSARSYFRVASSTATTSTTTRPRIDSYVRVVAPAVAIVTSIGSVPSISSCCSERLIL
jgi:hypothetical protein